MRLYRHGDVLLREVKGKKLVGDKKEVVLAEGEITGHSHRLACPNGLIADQILNGKRYIDVPALSMLSHEEHGEMRIDPGHYEVIIEREWDYIGNQKRKVVD